MFEGGRAASRATSGGQVPILKRVWTDEERAQKLAKLEAKLKPERIRSTLAFAGLYQRVGQVHRWSGTSAARLLVLQP